MTRDIYHEMRPIYERAIEGTKFTLDDKLHWQLRHEEFPITIQLPGGFNEANSLTTYFRAPLRGQKDFAGMIAALQKLSDAHDYMVAKGFGILEGPGSFEDGVSIGYLARIHSEEELHERIRDCEESMR